MKLLVILIMSALLSACSAPLREVILAPQFNANSAAAPLGLPVQLQVLDHRVSKFSIKVLNQEPQVYLPHAQAQAIFESTLKQALESRGISVNPAAPTQFKVYITSLNARVNETMSKHTSDAQVDLLLEITKPNGEFSKAYKATGQLSGPLKHDQAKVENQLNNLIIQTITRMINDTEVIAFIKE
jgi:uncharacterized lipoprotein